MRNVTISVPDELKAKMDSLSEVNWSETCRKAIARYINERMNPTPTIELDIRDVRLDSYHQSGYPTLTATIRIHNKMNTNVIVDRILSNVDFWSSNEVYHIGSSFDLNRRVVLSSSIGQAQLFLPIFKEKIESLEGEFKSTFPCIIHCIVIANGFKNPYNQDVRTEIPIDKWKKFTKNSLKPHQTTRNRESRQR